MIETNPQLVPGSVWQRVRKGNATFTTVLFVSNSGLSEAVLEQFPAQVVFLSDKMNVLTQDVETFLSSRTFHTIDTGVENLLRALLSPPDEDDVDESIDNIQLDDEPSILGEVVGDPDEGDDGIDMGDDSADVAIFTPQFFNGFDLDSAFVSYTEAPFHTGDTLHILRFALSPQLTLDHLKAAFDLSGETPAIEMFVVDCNHEHPTTVNVAGFVQVFLEVGADGNGVGAVYVTSSGDYRSQPEPTVEVVQQPEQLVVIPQVQTPAAQQVQFP